MTEFQSVNSLDLMKILDVARALATVRDLDEILKLIIRSACGVLKADRASVFLVDVAKQELYIRVAMGDEMKEIRFPISKGISGSVATTGEILNIPDAYQDERFNRDVDVKTGYRTKSILTVPLNTGEKIVGVLQFINKEGDGVFTEYDEAVATALAAQAAVTIHNFWLNQEYLNKKQMEASLDIARTIQKSFLPEKAPEVEGLEVHGFSESCDETGGDYYDYYKIDDDRIVVTIGDVTGHGVGSALLMATARSALHALWQKEHDPRVLLETLNDLLATDMGGDRFITLFLGIFDMRRNVLTYSSAGHDSPLLYRPSDDSIMELDSTGIPLGMVEGMEFPNREIFLKPGDGLYMMTDGVWEAMNPKNETYGRERLFSFIRAHGDHGPRDTCEALVRDVEEFCDGASQRDDITLLTLAIRRRSGPLRILRQAELKDFGDPLFNETFSSTQSEKNRVLEEILSLLTREGLMEDVHEMMVRLCLDEALVNAVDHGNANDTSKKVRVRVSADERYWSIIVEDEGPGFADRDVPDPDSAEALELEHGRGVLIMVEFLDCVWYNLKGNAIQMIKRHTKPKTGDEEAET
ncbi:MAG: SpoIIE family protein phosphatase [Planctomycetota bacterium]